MNQALETPDPAHLQTALAQCSERWPDQQRAWQRAADLVRAGYRRDRHGIHFADDSSVGVDGICATHQYKELLMCEHDLAVKLLAFAAIAETRARLQ